MLMAAEFTELIEVQQATYTDTPMGPVRTWTPLRTHRAMVAQLRPDADQKTDYHQTWDTQRNYRVGIRGKQDYDLSTIRFVWKRHGFQLEVTSSEFLTPKRGSRISLYNCRRTDNVKGLDSDISDLL